MVTSSRIAAAMAVLLLTAACTADADGTGAADRTGVADGTDAPGTSGSADPADAAPAVPRLVGATGVIARTAPDWSVNGTATIGADAGSELAFAQVLVATDAFELRTVEFETQGLRGAEDAVEVTADVDVRLLPFGPLPSRFEVDALQPVGSSTARARIRSFDPGPGTFPRLDLDRPLDVRPGGCSCWCGCARPSGSRRSR